MEPLLVDGRWLARFRANPHIVRVSIRRDDGGWAVAVQELRGYRRIARAWNKSPAKAVVVAMRIAESECFGGIDMGMDWTYDHPQRERQRSRA